MGKKLELFKEITIIVELGISEDPKSLEAEAAGSPGRRPMSEFEAII